MNKYIKPLDIDISEEDTSSGFDIENLEYKEFELVKGIHRRKGG